jgi:hypothetical protein
VPGVNAARAVARESGKEAVILAAATSYPVLWDEIGTDDEGNIYFAGQERGVPPLKPPPRG